MSATAAFNELIAALVLLSSHSAYQAVESQSGLQQRVLEVAVLGEHPCLLLFDHGPCVP